MGRVTPKPINKVLGPSLPQQVVYVIPLLFTNIFKQGKRGKIKYIPWPLCLKEIKVYHVTLFCVISYGLYDSNFANT